MLSIVIRTSYYLRYELRASITASIIKLFILLRAQALRNSVNSKFELGGFYFEKKKKKKTQHVLKK